MSEPLLNDVPKSVKLLCFEVDEDILANFAVNASWIVNWGLLAIKIVAVLFSESKAVAASLADSAVDLASQFIMYVGETLMEKHNPDFPIGRSKMEAISVLGCAFIMVVAMIEVIEFSVQDLVHGFEGDLPVLDVGVVVFTILSVGIGLKFILYFYCVWANTLVHSDILGALAEDHINDVFSNIGAIFTAAIASQTIAWWVDPVGAILISGIIIIRWTGITFEQINKIVGFTADSEFIEKVALE